ncbi:hypothetical protein ABT237_13635 [Streptomyces sp. NPDC001581]|uniref:hypothetical protein n=1 Tax=Streptomyces sp. NPDC001581 TaxID=3154386 RepID=UPI003324A49B
MCNNIYAKPYPVAACAADYQTTLDSAGRYTYVVSTPADRPGNATTANDVTWLAWGTNLIGRPAPRDLLLMRNMLPAPGFTHAVQNVPPDGNPDTARDVMGAYYPEAVYCSTTLFEVGGADACFAQAEHPDGPHKPGGPGHGKPGKPAEPGRSGKTGMQGRGVGRPPDRPGHPDPSRDLLEHRGTVSACRAAAERAAGVPQQPAPRGEDAPPSRGGATPASIRQGYRVPARDREDDSRSKPPRGSFHRPPAQLAVLPP